MFDLKPLEGGFPVIELKKYTIHEMSAILNSKGKQAIERKLKGYDIEFITSGRGDDVTTMPAILDGWAESRIHKSIINSKERREKMQKGWLER